MRRFLEISTALLLTTSLLAACAMIPTEAPKAELKDVLLRDVSLNGGTLIFVVKVINPNKSEVNLKQVHYETFLNEEFFSKASVTKPLNIPGNSAADVELPLPVTFSKIAGGVLRAISGKPLTYRVRGTAEVAFFTLPFDEKGELKFQPPKALN